MNSVYHTLGLNGNYAGNYKIATILTIRPDQERQMTAEQLKVFKKMPTWGLSTRWLQVVAWHRMSSKVAVYEFPNGRQLWVIQNKTIYPTRYILLAMPLLPELSGVVHGLGAWTVSKTEYLKVFG